MDNLPKLHIYAKLKVFKICVDLYRYVFIGYMASFANYKPHIGHMINGP